MARDANHDGPNERERLRQEKRRQAEALAAEGLPDDTTLETTPLDALAAGTTDAANAERGTVKEGEISPAGDRAIARPILWAQGDETPQYSTFAVGSTAAPEASSDTPAEAPDGWVRDVEGDLWDMASVSGLKVTANRDRMTVVAVTPDGAKSLNAFMGANARESAAAYRDTLAVSISAAKGYTNDNEEQS